ncbi:MAG TPA: DctP family TRAP transporter solute-binding subunit [Burkholderiaceae bacterium]|jgi:methyl-accepting chemotaxis protein
MNSDNLTTGQRLGAGFGAILLVLASICGYAIFTLTELNAVTENLVQTDLSKARLVGTSHEQVQASFTALILLPNVPDTSAAAIRTRLNANLREIDAQIERLNAHPAAEEKELLTRLADAKARYMASCLAVLKLLDGGKKEEAAKTITSETIAAMEGFVAQLHTLGDLQHKHAQQTSAQSREGLESARWWIVMLGIFSAVLCASFAMLIGRGLRHQLGCEPRYLAWIAKRITSGNLSIEIHTLPSDQSSLLFAIKTMRDSLANLVGHARAGAYAVATSASEIANGNLDLSARTEHQASSLEETASAMEQMTATVKQNAGNASEANELALSASRAAQQGGAVVSNVIHTMDAIHDSSKKIVDIIAVINGIVFQTNILALNAAVEAAHAGEQGRGFGVVASEVRSLANRAAEAAKEIKALINDSVEKVASGTTYAAQAGATMEEVVTSIERVATVICEISQASREQTAGIEQINQAITSMDEMTQQNASLVQQASVAAEAMQDQAGTLAQVVSVFKLGDTATDATPISTSNLRPQVGRSASRALPYQETGFQPRLIRFGFGLEQNSNQGRGAEFLAKELSRRSGGKLKLKGFANASLGTDPDMQKALIAGSLEMMVGSTSTLVSLDSDFGVFDLPFIFSDEREADAVLDGSFGQKLRSRLLDHGLVALVYWENGFRNLTNATRPIAKMEDLRGVKLRVMQNPIYIEMFKNFGAEPVALAFADLFAALESGEVNGQENPLNTIQSSKFYEVQKYLSMTRHVYSPWIVMASRKWWESLSKDEQKAVLESAEAARDFERTDTRNESARALEFLKQNGMQVTVVNEKELQRMRDKVKPIIDQFASGGHAQVVTDLRAALRG